MNGRVIMANKKKMVIDGNQVFREVFAEEVTFELGLGR